MSTSGQTHATAAPVQVTQTTAPSLQRACACGQHTGGGECEGCRKKREGTLQRSAVGPAHAVAPPIVHDVLRSPGQPLDPAARSFMEPRFGHDFSHVRVHTDARAAESARAVNALAYTVGRDIVFGAGHYAPETSSGQRLLAHELTHVVQQRQGLQTFRIGPPDDMHEREANLAAEAVTSLRQPAPVITASQPGLQRSVLGTIGDILAFPFVALYRLFGGEYYQKETLQEYLANLKKRADIENKYDSDNKARACVKREAELGPYDTNTKVLLIREMLSGHTSGRDEGSIIALLRRQTPADRAQIVATIGRDNIWKKFSGENRRIVEAITLTAADARGAALVERLRRLSEDELQDYVSNALDPDVKAAAQRAAQLQKITAPVPSEATVNPQGVASFQINGVDVQAQPDSTSNEERLRNRAVTEFSIDQDKPASDILSDPATNTIVSFTPPHLLAVVKTVFGPGTEPGGSSGYGRGTTAEDKSAGSTSVRFHESRHGQDWFDFLAQNPPPVFGGRAGMTVEDFRKAEQQFQADIEAYNQRALAYSVKKTDCPGTPATEEQLSPFGLTAAICHQQ